MSLLYRISESRYASRPSAQEIMTDHRSRLLLEETERARNRELQRQIQRSNLNTPEMRIRAWETAHALRLPSSSTHPVLNVVANDTGLTLTEIQEEQCARQARRTAAKL
jgi:hypothetical protein